MRAITRAATALVAVILCLAGGWSPSAASNRGVHHQIEVRLDPESGGIQVKDVMPLDDRKELVFRLAPWLRVEEVLVDGTSVRPTLAGGFWQVALPDGGAGELELTLRGDLPAFGSGQAGVVSPGSGRDGSFLPSSAAWIPDTGESWTAYRLTVEVPPPYRAVATGQLIDEVMGDDGYRATFVGDYPAEPPSLFVGAYEIRERDADGLRLRTYFEAGQNDLSDTYLDAAADFIQRYADRVGPYPYRDFHIVSAPLPVGLGFPGLTYVSRQILPLPFMRGRSLAHEVLHNWWGNGVAVDYRQGNWAEGLTTYMADYALAAERGDEVAREMRLGWLRDFAALPAARDRPAAQFTAKRHDASQVVGYNKVAFVFHMLRQEVGEEAFKAALRRFWRDHRFKTAGWSDLQRTFEQASGRALGWFFRQWLERAGAPELSLGTVKIDGAEGGHRLDLTVHQTEPTYRLSAPVVIETAAGTRREWVELDGPATSVSLHSESVPLAVALDPDFEVFRRLLSGESPPILRDVTLADDAVAVVLGDDPAVHEAAEALVARLLDTPARIGDSASTEPGTAPVLIIGTPDEVALYLDRIDLARPPVDLGGEGSARAWTTRRANGQPLLVVSADDAEALAALKRPLPHYGGKSFVVFQGRRAIRNGIWPTRESPLRRQLVD